MAFNDGPPFGPVVNGTMVVIFWEYRPSNVAAYTFLALFALATFGHLVYLFWLRPWTFIPFLLGGICESPPFLPNAPPDANHPTLFNLGEVFGYYERARAHSELTVLGPWLLQNMLLLVAPPLLAATVYMSYGRISTALLEGSYKARSRRDRGCCARCCHACCCTVSSTRVYVFADIAAIFTQLIGTVLPASGTPEAERLSKIIVLVGLCIQLVALSIFLIGCCRLHARLRRDPSQSCAMLIDPGVNWLGYLAVLEVSAVMLIVRSGVRGAEFLGGTDGPVASHEAFIYVFDAVPMFVVMLGLLLLHPSRLVREVARLEEYLHKGQRREMAELRDGGSRAPGGLEEGRKRSRNQDVPVVFRPSQAQL